MKLLSKAIFLLFFASTVTADSLTIDTLWTKTFGGPGNDYGVSLQKTTDNGYIVCGYTNSYGAGNYDLWLIKTDSNGIKEWDKTYGGSADDYASSMCKTIEGGYIICGRTWSYGAGNYDVWLIKVDSDGNKQWEKTFGGPAYDYGKSVLQTADKGYIICGCTWSYDVDGGDVWVIKTDSAGNKQWDKTFGGTATDIGNSIIQNSDNNYVICGETNSYGAGVTDAWLIKLDTLGNKLWSKTIGNVNYDISNSIIPLSDGDSGYIVGGYTWSYGTGNYDAWLIKTDSIGTKKWDRAYGGPQVDMQMSLLPLSGVDSGYAFCGYTTSFGMGDYDLWILKTDSDGLKQYNKTFGGVAADVGLSMMLVSNMTDRYVVCGWTESYGAGMSDVWLVKTGKSQEIEEKYKQEKIGLITKNYPNPFKSETRIEYIMPQTQDMELAVYNLSGQKITILDKGSKDAGQYSVKWDRKDNSGKEVPNGTYFYKLTADRFTQTRKLIIFR